MNAATRGAARLKPIVMIVPLDPPRRAAPGAEGLPRRCAGTGAAHGREHKPNAAAPASRRFRSRAAARGGAHAKVRAIHRTSPMVSASAGHGAGG